MRTIKRMKNGVRITDQTPSCRDFAVKAKKLYRETIAFVKKTPVLNDMYEMNIAKQKRKAASK